MSSCFPRGPLFRNLSNLRLKSLTTKASYFVLFFPARLEKITEKSSSLLRYQDREGCGRSNHHALACGRCTENRRKLPLFVHRRKRVRVQEFQLSSNHSRIHASGNSKTHDFVTFKLFACYFSEKHHFKSILNF